MSIEFPYIPFHNMLSSDYYSYDFPESLTSFAEKSYEDGKSFAEEYNLMNVRIANRVKKSKGWFASKYSDADLHELCDSVIKKLDISNLTPKKSLYLGFFLEGFDSNFAKLFTPLLFSGGASSVITNNITTSNGNIYILLTSQKIDIMTSSYWRLTHAPEFYLYDDYHKAKQIRDLDNRNHQYKVFRNLFEKYFYGDITEVIDNMANNLRKDILKLYDDQLSVEKAQTEFRLYFIKNAILTPRKSLPMVSRTVSWGDKVGLVLYDFFNGDSFATDIDLDKIKSIIAECGSSCKEIYPLGNSGALFLEFDVGEGNMIENFSAVGCDNINEWSLLVKAM